MEFFLFVLVGVAVAFYGVRVYQRRRSGTSGGFSKPQDPVDKK